MGIGRNRLLNAIVFFAKNTRYCGKIKLFKLLYLLDFEHFQQTGKSVTGAEYSAWKFGPVPDALMEEWEQPSEDFLGAVEIVPEQVVDYVRQTVHPRVEFDEANFTPRQLRIMSNLAEIYKDTLSPTMIDVTHAQNGAWAQVWADGKGQRKPIAYHLAIDDGSPYAEAVREQQRHVVERAAAKFLTHEMT